MDGVSSIASIDFRMDEWGVDVAISGSQKGFMLPTGLAILCVSQKALGKGVYHINAVDCVTQWEEHGHLRAALRGKNG